MTKHDVLVVAGALLCAGIVVLSASSPDAAPGAGAGSAANEASTPDGGLRPTVRVIFQTIPPEKAQVYWGKKLLGVIRDKKRPFILERQRDSGPLDVTVRAEGYLPVHTRAYTFTDSRVTVKLTKVEEKQTLFGYRAELPPPDGGVPDGGVAAPPVPRPDAGMR